MPEPKTPKGKSGTSPTTPESFPTTPAAFPSSSDYSYFETVMDLQRAMGRLESSVENLKQASEQQRSKIDDIGRDIHTGKVTIRIVGAILAGVLAFATWTIGKGIDVFLKLQSAPVQHTQSEPQK